MDHGASRGPLRSSVARLRESIATRARACRWRATPGRGIAGAATSAGSSASSTRRPAAPIGCPMGAVYEATMRCNLHCEFCYVGDLLNIEGEWREEMTLDALAQGVPRQPGLPGQPDRRRDLHAEGHHVRPGSLPRKGLRLRLPDDQRHDHHRGAGRGAGRSRGGRVPEAHQRLDRRPRRAPRRRARPEGHVRADAARGCGACRRRPAASTRRCASASTRPSRTRASTRSTRWSTSPRSSASMRSASIT